MRFMRNIKLTIEYDGTNYCGFQVQENTGLRTIQGVLEEKLALLSREPIRIAGAGRTDSGVHARGQVVHFFSQWKIPREKITVAVNSVLPKDIVVKSAEDVPEEFHARFSTKGKKYLYRIYNDRVPSAFEDKYAWFIPYRLDFEKMREGASYLVGEHDFSSFKSSGSVIKNNIRTIWSLELSRQGPVIEIEVMGNGFLYNMVRIITGTLIEVGRGRRKPLEIKEILNAKDRNKAGPTALPKGLFLTEVFY